MNLRTILTALSLSVLVACGDDGGPEGRGASLPQAGTEVSAETTSDLNAQGKTSEVASLQVGATVEDLDIKDLELMKARVSDPAILSMYEALQCGSRNHLRSFTSNLAQRGESYKAQYISAEAMQNILSTGQESCGK